MILQCVTNTFLRSFFFLQPSSHIFPAGTNLPGYAGMAVDSLQVAGILSVYEGYSQNRHDSSRWRHVRRRHCLERYFHFRFRYVDSSVCLSVRLSIFLLFFFCRSVCAQHWMASIRNYEIAIWPPGK